MHQPQSDPTTVRRAMNTRTLAYSALLTALSVVLARLVIPMPNAFTRFSIEAVPIFLAGALFGPITGGLVGFAADFIGCLFSGYGYNPLFCLPPILYGVCAGLFRPMLRRRITLPRLLLAFAPAVAVGSILWQSFALAFVYNSKGSFEASFLYFLGTRTIQFAITMVADVLVVRLIFQSRIFEQLNIRPPRAKN